jgi:hypothetical protein
MKARGVSASRGFNFLMMPRRTRYLRAGLVGMLREAERHR